MTFARVLISMSVLAAITSLGLLTSGCGSGRDNATSAASVGKPNSTSTSSSSQKFYEEPKLDADKDTDGEDPDEDDGKKLVPTDRDGDHDSSGKSRFDSDDQRFDEFGHPASISARATIAALVRRFYAAADVEDGRKACSMLYSVFAEAAPEDYGTSPPGPGYAHGGTCAAVLTKVFTHFHEEIQAKLPKLKVAQVRVSQREGIALLSFGDLPERLIHVLREGRAWRIQALVDEELE